MGWREKNRPEGDFLRWTSPGHNVPWKYRWLSHYQERRLWDSELGRLARSPSSLKDGWRGDRCVKLTRSWKRHRKARYKVKPT